jgi:hypothetical protein
MVILTTWLLATYDKRPVVLNPGNMMIKGSHNGMIGSPCFYDFMVI